MLVAHVYHPIMFIITWQDLEPEAIMDGFSQEALGLLSRSATTAAAAASVQPSRLGLFGSEITNMAAGAVSPSLSARPALHLIRHSVCKATQAAAAERRLP